MKKDYFNFFDIIIYSFIILIISSLFIASVSLNSSNINSKVEVFIKNKIEYIYPLTKEKHIYTIDAPLGKEKIVIYKKSVEKNSASCPKKICMSQGKISKPGEFIICIPNKEIIKITSKKNKLDSKI